MNEATAPAMTDAEAAELARLVADLHESGYRDIAEHKNLRVGTRIRHRGEQYPQAYEHGTGVVVALTEKPDSRWSQSWRMPDVELVMLRDTAQFGSRLSQLGQYHVEVVGVTP